MINNNGPSTLPCGIPLSTEYESDSEELIFYFVVSIMEKGVKGLPGMLLS